MARARAPDAGLSRPPWLAIAVLAAVAAGAICYPAWPGFMSYDSLIAYEQARYGVILAAMPTGINAYVFASYYNRGVNVATSARRYLPAPTWNTPSNSV